MSSIISKIMDFFYFSHVKEKSEREIYVTDLAECMQKREFYKQSSIFPAVHGNIVHFAVQSLLLKYGFKIEVPIEYKLKNGYVLHGRVDALSPDNVPIEIKTASNIKIEHVFQLMVYMFILNAKSGELLYVSNNTVSSFLVDKDNIQSTDTGEVFKNTIVINDDMLNNYANMYLEKKLIAHLGQCNECWFKDRCKYAKL